MSTENDKPEIKSSEARGEMARSTSSNDSSDKIAMDKLEGNSELIQSRNSDLQTIVSREVDSDFYRFVWIVLRGWWIILIVVILSVTYAGYSLTKHGPTYKAHMLLREVTKGTTQSIQMPTRMANLAANFGIPVGPSGSTNFKRLTLLFGTTPFAEYLDSKYGYIKRVYGGSWDEENKRWIAPTGWQVDLDNFFRRFAPIPEWQPPRSQELANYIRSNISIVPYPAAKDIFRLEFRHPDRDFALEFLRNVYFEAEQELSSQEIKRESSLVSYFKTQLAKVSISEYRDALFFVLAGREKRLIELQSGAPYAAIVIAPPSVSEKPSKPNVFVRLVLGGIIGLGLGIVVVLIVAISKRIISQRPSKLA